jgi:arsenite methyltransferase
MITETNEQIKNMVKEKYGEIAAASLEDNQSSCCGATSSCCDTSYTIFSEDYSKLEGYNPDADLGLGCGIPTQFARMKKGDTVIDLGSGAGNDAFVARSIVGETGKVIGVDMTEAMIEKARANNEKLDFNNVEFRLGEIEKLPVHSDRADVVLSNCVLNLVPDKNKAFSEIFRVLKPGGHFCISDIVLSGNLPEKLQKSAEMYAGCVSGALLKEEYLDIIQKTGFVNKSVPKEKEIKIPKEILLEYLSEEEIQKLESSNSKILSITVFAEKPTESCCGSTGCC